MKIDKNKVRCNLCQNAPKIPKCIFYCSSSTFNLKCHIINNHTELCNNIIEAIYSEEKCNYILDHDKEKEKARIKLVWKYFTKLKSGKLMCNLCTGIELFICNPTDSVDHLESKHNITYTINKNHTSGFNFVLVDKCNDTNEIKCKTNLAGTLAAIDRKTIVAYKTWNYFTKLDYDNSIDIKCNLCDVLFPHCIDILTYLTRHLNVVHKDDLKEEDVNLGDEMITPADLNYEEVHKIMERYKITKGTKGSKVWKYFTIVGGYKARCNLCSDIFGFSRTSYSNLSRHIRKIHPEVITVKDNDKNNTGKAKRNRSKSNANELTKIAVITVSVDQEPEVADNKALDNTFNYSTSSVGETMESDAINNTIKPTMTPVKNAELNELSDAQINPKDTNSNSIVSEVEQSDKYPNTIAELSKSPVKKVKRVQDITKSKVNISSDSKTKKSSVKSNTDKLVKTPVKKANKIPDVTNSKTNKSELKKSGVTESKSPIKEESGLKIPKKIVNVLKIIENNKKLRNCFKLEDKSLVCKQCYEVFTSYNIVKLKEHMQIYHAEWHVVCSEDFNKDSKENVNNHSIKLENKIANIEMNKPEILDESSEYNELEAIANEINLFKMESLQKELKETKDSMTFNNEEKLQTDSSKEKLPYNKYKNVWKYFTKITSTNVRCNFCTLLLTFKESKKWNLYRHLHLKHQSKMIKEDLLELNTTNKFISTPKNKTSPIKRSNENPSPLKTPSMTSSQKIELKSNFSSKKTTTKSQPLSSSSIKYDSDEEYGHIKTKKVFINRVGRTWSHFTKVHLGKAICNMCHMSVHYLGNGGDVLNKHLDDFHIKKQHCKSNKNKNFECSRTLRSRNTDNKSNSNKITVEKVNKQEKRTPNKNSNDTKNKLVNEEEDSNKLEVDDGNESLDNESKNKVWLYFNKEKNGFANCQLCLKSISFKGKILYLIRHLHRIHSVVSIPLPKKDDIETDNENKEKKQVLAAVDLTPSKLGSIKFDFCYRKLRKGFVKCNFCSKMLSNKTKTYDKLINHLQNMHCEEIMDENKSILKNIKLFKNSQELKGLMKDVDLSTCIPSTDGKSVIGASNKKKSETWLYYTKINKQYAQCTICDKALSYKGGSVYNLTRHLANKHDIKILKLEMQENKNVKEIGNLTKMEPSFLNFCKSKKETLSYFTKINRNFVKCKLCRKRLVYKGLSVKRLMKHLWTSHINKIIAINKSSKLPLQQSKKSKISKENLLTISNNEQINNNASVSSTKKPDSSGRFLTSDVWKFFSKNLNDNTLAQCNLCQKFLSYKNGNISNLSRHLLRYGINLSKTNVHQGKIKVCDFGKFQESPINDNDFKNEENTLMDQNEYISIKDIAGQVEAKGTSKTWEFYIRLNESEVQCVICNNIISFKEGKIKNLQYHLFNYHKNDESVMNSNMFRNISNISLDQFFIKKPKEIKLFKVRCKLCYKYLVYKKKNKQNKLIEHLKYHDTDLLEDESIMVQKFVFNKSFPENKCIIDDNFSDGNFDMNKTLDKYFKDIKYKNKCQICNKFITNKIQCSHRVNCDLSISCGIHNKRHLLIDDDNLSKIKKRCTNKVNHFVNVNYLMNKCGFCDVPTTNKGFCCHSVKQMINDNEIPIEKPVDDSDELRIITDALSSGENKIIIVTDDLNPPILNCDIDNNEAIDSDDGKHYVNSGKTDIHDIEVVYDYNPDERLLTSDDIKMKDIHSIPDSVEVSDSALEEQVKVILGQLNEHNEGNVTFEKVSDDNSQGNLYFNKDISVNKDTVSIVKQITTDGVIVEKIETDLFSGNNSFDENESLMKTLFANPDKIEQMPNEISNEINTFNLNNPSIKPELNNLNIIQDQIVSTNISDNIQEEVIEDGIVNIEEIMKDLNKYFYENDLFDFKAGVTLQNFHNIPVSKTALCFSSIIYEKRIAKCNLCKEYLFFQKPIIRDLISHLYSKHSDELIKNNPIDIDSKNSKKLIELLNTNSESEKVVVKASRKKSPVWKYFVCEDTKATCKICKYNFSFKNHAANNLRRHLRLKHDIVFDSNNQNDINLSDLFNLDNTDHSIFPFISKKRTKSRLRSKTWNYFSREPNDWAKCILCNKYLSYRSSTINNLTRHLKTVHADIFSSLFLSKDEVADGENVDVKEEVIRSMFLETMGPRNRDEILQECSYAANDNANKKKKSVVWNYFTEFSNKTSQCNFCMKMISSKGGGTSNLSRHLRVKHSIWIVMTNNLSENYGEQFLGKVKTDESNAVDSISNPGNEPNDTIITHEQLQILKNMKPLKRNIIWDYFEKRNQETVACKICSKTLSYKCKAIHNLKRHLMLKHPSVRKRETGRLKLQIDTGDGAVNNEDKTFIDITDTSVVIVDEENAPPVRKADRINRPKKSFVWNFFDELDDCIAKCQLCPKLLSFRGGGTNNLMRHLRSRHSLGINLQFPESISISKDSETVTNTDNLTFIDQVDSNTDINTIVIKNENSL